jgi:hypothetical protein
MKSCGHQNSDPLQSKEEKDPHPRNPEALRHLRMVNPFYKSHGGATLQYHFISVHEVPAE